MVYSSSKRPANKLMYMVQQLKNIAAEAQMPLFLQAWNCQASYAV